MRLASAPHRDDAIDLRAKAFGPTLADVGPKTPGAITLLRTRPPYFFTAPRLKTSHERYTWVNQTLFIGQGRVVAYTTVEYRVYPLAN